MRKSYVFIIFLAVFALTLDTCFCERLLMLNDAEVEQRNLTRIYTNVRDYYAKNESAVQVLYSKGFFECPADHFNTDEESTNAFHELAEERKSYVAQNYKSEDVRNIKYIKSLYKDLMEISEILTSNTDEGFFFNLENKEKVDELESFVGILLQITSYFRYLAANNIAL